MSSPVPREPYVRRHRKLLIVLGVLIVIYIVTSLVHQAKSFDYTDRAVAIAKKTTAQGKPIGLLSETTNTSWSTKKEPTRSEVEALVKPGNEAFAPLYTALAAKSTSLPKTTAKDRASEDACYLLPVVPHQGDPITKVIGLTRVCFDDDTPKRPYSGASLSISNR